MKELTIELNICADIHNKILRIDSKHKKEMLSFGNTYSSQYWEYKNMYPDFIEIWF